eukprot:31305-Chlamydomonas_euryale.AAC.1
MDPPSPPASRHWLWAYVQMGVRAPAGQRACGRPRKDTRAFQCLVTVKTTREGAQSLLPFWGVGRAQSLLSCRGVGRAQSLLPCRGVGLVCATAAPRLSHLSALNIQHCSPALWTPILEIALLIPLNPEAPTLKPQTSSLKPQTSSLEP